MDDAALRVNASSLRAILRLRSERERQALRDLQASLADRAAAVAGRDAAQRALRVEENRRRTREAELYQALSGRGPVTTDALESQRAFLARWTEDVEAAADRLGDAQAQAARAEEAVAAARRAYAARARAAQKWTRIDTLAGDARRRISESASERESEDHAPGAPRTQQGPARP